MLMVHFVGVPPGTADLLIKFVPPETLERFGGAGKYAEAVNNPLARLGEMLRIRRASASCCLANISGSFSPEAGPRYPPSRIRC
jgi:hypothetical protein